MQSASAQYCFDKAWIMYGHRSCVIEALLYFLYTRRSQVVYTITQYANMCFYSKFIFSNSFFVDFTKQLEYNIGEERCLANAKVKADGAARASPRGDIKDTL